MAPLPPQCSSQGAVAYRPPKRPFACDDFWDTASSQPQQSSFKPPRSTGCTAKQNTQETTSNHRFKAPAAFSGIVPLRFSHHQRLADGMPYRQVMGHSGSNYVNKCQSGTNREIQTALLQLKGCVQDLSEGIADNGSRGRRGYSSIANSRSSVKYGNKIHSP